MQVFGLSDWACGSALSFMREGLGSGALGRRALGGLCEGTGDHGKSSLCRVVAAGG